MGMRNVAKERMKRRATEQNMLIVMKIENLNMDMGGKAVPKAPGIIPAATAEHLQINNQSKSKQSGTLLIPFLQKII